jgi:thiamine-monophosphate kinase
MSESKRTELNNLGEFGVIEHLTEGIECINDTTVFGIGDDAAVLKGYNGFSLLSTDMLVEGVHFDLMYSPLKHVGYKAISSNVSDVCAMNGVAKQVTVSIAISNRFSLEALEDLYAGIKKACELYRVDLVGGDTTSSKSGLVISISVLGEVNESKITYRAGAKENDLLVVTGDLGGAYMGLQVLERERSVFKANDAIQPDLDGFDYILERQLKPEARVDIVHFLNELDVCPTSMIDVSDGLASESLHIAKSSNVGIRIYDEKIPIDPTTYQVARDFNLDPSTIALNGGEDYELLFTIKQQDYDKIKGNPNWTVIGHVVDKSVGSGIILKEGKIVPLEAQGWDHFTAKE